MLFFAHLFAGAVIGIICAIVFRDARLFVVASLAAIIPDLIDKPLGHVLLVQSIDNGRLIGHGLVLVVAAVVIGLVLWHRSRDPAGFVGAGALLSHQLLDSMWNEPVTWYYPLLGPYIPESHPEYFVRSLWMELTSPSEWAFLLIFVAMAVGLLVWQRKNRGD
ncbi:MAG: metal-dependent hydrolase [Methanomicrobiales archaeon]